MKRKKKYKNRYKNKRKKKVLIQDSKMKNNRKRTDSIEIEESERRE